MAYVFENEKTSKFKFQTNDSEHGGGVTQKTTLVGINPTLASADSICAGVSALMAIGHNVPYYNEQGVRTVNQVVYTD